MRCKEVQEKLPEYLAGILDENTKAQIDQHLKACDACNMELKALNEDVAFDIRKTKDINEARIIRKTKVKFNLAILRTVVLILAVLLLISLFPTILRGVQSALGQSKASRALMDFVQFSQPSKVNMWGNSAAQGFSLSMPLKIGVRPVVGHGFREQLEFTGKMSILTGKVTVPVFLGANFIHPNIFMDEDFDGDRSKDAQMKMLEKNAETTVSTVDYSLKKIISLTDIEALISKYDVELLWMAVEAGIEHIKPKNMTLQNQQVLQWGIPGKLSRPGDFDFAILKRGSLEAFEAAVMEELTWLDDNKSVLKPDSGLLKNNGVNNSVKGQARYIMDNGIKIYGLSVTGPSNEIIRLTMDLDVRTMSVVDMDFWNW